MNNASGLSRYWGPDALSRVLCNRKGKKKIFEQLPDRRKFHFFGDLSLDVILETKCVQLVILKKVSLEQLRII